MRIRASNRLSIIPVFYHRTLHTIKLGPAVSRKELEKALDKVTDPEVLDSVHKMRAGIEIIRNFRELGTNFYTVEAIVKNRPTN
jgi:hypothetical protein